MIESDNTPFGIRLYHLIPARKVLYVAVTVILSNDSIELATVQERC